MKPSLWRLLCFVALAVLVACSTPISPYPQIEDEEEQVPIDSGPRDAGPSDAGRSDAATADAGSFACDVYSRGASCPSSLPTVRGSCTPPSTTERCFYPSPTPGQIQIAECLRERTGRGIWQISAARCSYRCATDLPQTTNFFSLLTDGCSGRRVQACQDGTARTSQEGADRFLRSVLQTCGLPATFQAGVTFNQQGCADWFHYQTGPALTTAQKECLTNRLEAPHLACGADCAAAPSTAP